jgi:hypothetical protein
MARQGPLTLPWDAQEAFAFVKKTVLALLGLMIIGGSVRANGDFVQLVAELRGIVFCCAGGVRASWRVCAVGLF